MNILITGSNGYIGKSIFNSKIEKVEKIIFENNSKSKITTRTQKGLNYNGSFYKILHLPISFQYFESGLKKTIINTNKQQMLTA